MLTERELMERQDLGISPAARMAAQTALTRAGVSIDDIGCFDFYSCFPIAVFNVAHDSFGLNSEDPRQLTVTGGLPYFGGPGNNYSMHAIASLTERLRAHPGSYGFIGANGGFLSKYAAAVYSTRPAPWRERDSAQLQREIDAMPAPLLLEQADGEGYIETYTIIYKAGQPATAIIVGRLTSEEQRFLALSDPTDPTTLQFMAEADPLRAPVRVRSTAEGNRFVLRRDGP
jgi:acetyl-CoA C-acetyltransferase